MCADQHNHQPPASAPDPESAQPNPKKVRSTRYDWANDLAPADHPEQGRSEKLAARSSLLRRMFDWLRDVLGAGQNPFDRDDDPDPMAA